MLQTTKKNRFDCNKIVHFQSPGCTKDKLLISEDGSSEFKNAHVYCGRGQTVVQSNGSRLAIGLYIISWPYHIFLHVLNTDNLLLNLIPLILVHP